MLRSSLRRWWRSHVSFQTEDTLRFLLLLMAVWAAGSLLAGLAMKAVAAASLPLARWVGIACSLWVVCRCGNQALKTWKSDKTLFRRRALLSDAIMVMFGLWMLGVLANALMEG
jgi:hypothetical protein